MKKFGCGHLTGLGRILVLSGLAYVVWRVVRLLRGEETAAVRTIDKAIGAAAHMVEKSVEAVDREIHNGVGKNIGKGIDAMVTETKKTLEAGSDLVRNALRHKA